MYIAGLTINTTEAKFDKLIKMRHIFLTDPKTALSVDEICSFARDVVGLSDCYSFRELEFYIDEYLNEG